MKYRIPMGRSRDYTLGAWLLWGALGILAVAVAAIGIYVTFRVYGVAFAP